MNEPVITDTPARPLPASEAREYDSFNDFNEQSRSSFLGQICAEGDIYDLLDPCTYCGLPADSVDHIPPKHIRLQLSEVQLRSLTVLVVPSCRECNSALGCRPMLTIGERRGYIHQWLRRKYAKYLRIPQWTEEALSEVSQNLQGMIRRGMAIRDLTKARCQWTGVLKYHQQ